MTELQPERPHHFSAAVAESGGGSVVVVPAEIAGLLASDRAQIDALVNGEPYAVRLGSWKRVCYLRLRKDLLRKLGVSTGDLVEISFAEVPEPPAEPDAEVDPVDSPELTSALTDEPFARAWAALPEDHRREYRRWIAVGEDAATRGDRVSRLARRLRARRP